MNGLLADLNSAPAGDIVPHVSNGHLYADRRLFLRTGRIADTVRPLVRESWKRCREHGVDPEAPLDQSVDHARLRTARSNSHNLIFAAQACMEFIHETLTKQRHMVMLADAEGLVIQLLSVVGPNETSEEESCLEGTSLNERNAGSNGVGTCLVEGKPVIIIGAEHYLESNIDWTCIGVPIKSPGGKILGAIGLGVPTETLSIHTWGWMLSIGASIEEHLAGLVISEREQTTLKQVHDPLVAIRQKLEVIAADMTISQAHRSLVESATKQVDAATDQLRMTVAQLLATQKEFREADARKDKFISVLGHELRNPLYAVSLISQCIRQAPGISKEIDQFSAEIESQVAFMTRLIEDLLELSRMRNGKMAMRKRRVDLRHVIEETVKSIDSEIQRHNHQLTLHAPNRAFWVNADPDRLRQVIFNLLHNSAKYTPPGGKIATFLNRTDNEIVLRVRDNGNGIPAETLPHIFKLYSQVNPLSKQADGGLGIGLALVQGIVLSHGGTVSAHSEGIGKGSEFTVRLPIMDDE